MPGTVSMNRKGGEPLLQPAFTGEVLRRSHYMGLHTALDTSGFLGDRADDALLENTDLVLLDIKSWDPATSSTPMASVPADQWPLAAGPVASASAGSLGLASKEPETTGPEGDPMKNTSRRLLSGADRIRRRAGLDRNPLRRREDHIQTAITWSLLLIFLVAATVTAHSVSSHAYRTGLRIEQSQRMNMHQVTATVVPSASGFQVIWKDSDGTTYQAAYPVGTMSSGNKARIWVDPSGKVAKTPRRHAQTIADAVLAGSGMFLAALALLTACLWSTGNLLNRRRSRSWELAWERTDIRYGQPGRKPDQK
jgi:hypothetical protein